LTISLTPFYQDPQGRSERIRRRGYSILPGGQNSKFLTLNFIIMDDFLYNTFSEMNLKFTPHTKSLLKLYANDLDENLVVTDEFLKSELLTLCLSSNLECLITCEWTESENYNGNAILALEDVDLNYTPHTKQLLKKYISYEYEGTIEPTLENLKAELQDLHQGKRLGYLFAGEWIYSPGPQA